jgi:cold shock CspA family protein
MQIPLQITFRGMAPSAAIESVIRQRAAKLERFGHRITRCHVTVDIPHRHHHKGNHYAVRIEVSTPTGDVVVTRDPTLDESHKNFHAVIRDAFDSAVRHLEEDMQRQRDGKSHEQAPHGHVKSLFPAGGYGFLATSDGQEVYFHENSVIGAAFIELGVGSEVRFTRAPDDSNQGPRAASVSLLQ